MEINVGVSTHFACTLERAFKTPMLCDISKVHTGYGLMPKVTHCTEDENWGQVGSSKKVFVTKSFTQAGGFASVDHVLERIENVFWKIQVDTFQTWMLGFNKFTGVWKVTELEPTTILIEYTYTLHSNNPLFYPMQWVFARTFWNTYMKRVLENIRQMAYTQEPYQYD
jgi:hypothetical protein